MCKLTPAHRKYREVIHNCEEVYDMQYQEGDDTKESNKAMRL